MYHFDNLQSTDNTKRTRIRVSVTNKGRMEERETHRNQLRGKIVREESLVTHLQHDIESLGGPMGMVYYSYLEEACQDENVHLESHFSTDEARNETTAMMTVTI